MGVIYKLREEVVHYIVSQRQSNPLASCRQLAESASEKFGLHLSKSSVHDVLKESGIITPRGRKPKNKFEIPLEKKRQIQGNLSQVKLILPPSREPAQEIKGPAPSLSAVGPSIIPLGPPIDNPDHSPENVKGGPEISPEYEGAGNIFREAAFWDLGIYAKDAIKEEDWKFYLTYTKGVRLTLEDNMEVFIDLPLPLARCLREVADGLITNTIPIAIHNVSDENRFKACMQLQEGSKIQKISIVDHKNHEIAIFDNIVDCVRNYELKNRTFVENYEKSQLERARSIFFSQTTDINEFRVNILALKGWNADTANEHVVTLLFKGLEEMRSHLQEAVEKLNGMYLHDDRNRVVSIKIQEA